MNRVPIDTTYDGPLLTSTSWSGPVSGLLSQTYNANFVVVEQQFNGSPLSISYNADLQPTAIGALALTYNTSGRLAGTTLGSVSATFQYDTYGEVTQRRYKSGGVDVFVESFVTDDGGRIVSATETVDGVAVTSDYAYDTAGRLTDVFVGGAPRWHYEYDGNSNRVAFDDFVTNESASGTYDAQDRLLDYGGATFTYTENGELPRGSPRATTTLSSETSTPSRCPTAHIEGGFGLHKPTLGELNITASTPKEFALALLTLAVIVWGRTINHRARRDRGGRSRADLLQDSPS